METDLQRATLVYHVNTAEALRELTWGAPVFQPNTTPPKFVGLVAQHQPPQTQDLTDQGKIKLRVVTHGICVAPAPGNCTYTPGSKLGAESGWPHDPTTGGVRVLGVQHDSYRMGTLYRLLVRADCLCE